MKAKLSLFVLCLTLCWACSQSEAERKHEQAMALLDKVDSLKTAKVFPQAKKYLDSAMHLGELDTMVLRLVAEERRVVNFEEAEYELAHLNKMIDSLNTIIKAELPSFQVLKNKYYDTKELMEEKHLAKIAQQEKSYLRCRLDTLANMQVSSIYVGSKAIEHNQMILEQNGIHQLTTQAMAYDQAMNYQYKAGAKYWELVQYYTLDSDQFATFIEKLKDEPLKMTLLQDGKKRTELTISTGEVKALKQSVRLYRLYDERKVLLKLEQKFGKRFIRLERELGNA